MIQREYSRQWYWIRAYSQRFSSLLQANSPKGRTRVRLVAISRFMANRFRWMTL